MALVLVELNKQIRDSRETKRKVKASLMYPMILIVVAVIAVTVMLWLVVPTFAKMFKDMDAKLPGDHPVRRRRLGLHRRLRALRASSAIVVVVVAFKKFMKTETRPPVRRRRFSWSCPRVGELMVEMAMYRFASNLSLLLKSGVPMMETMNTIKGIFQNNPHLSRCPGAGRARVAAGQAAVRLRSQETGHFPAHAHQHGPGRRGIGPARAWSWSRSPRSTRRRWRQ